MAYGRCRRAYVCVLGKLIRHHTHPVTDISSRPHPPPYYSTQPCLRSRAEPIKTSTMFEQIAGRGVDN